MRFPQFLSVALMLALAANAGAEPVGLDEEFGLSGNATTEGTPNDGMPSVIYDAATGEVIMDTEGMNVDSFIFDSLAGIWTGLGPISFPGSTFFTTDTDSRIAQNFFTPVLNGAHSLGLVGQTGLTKAFLLNDLTLSGGLTGNPGFTWDLIVINEVAEPAAVILAMIALAAFGGYAARLRRQQAA